MNENVKKYLIYAVVLLTVGFAGYFMGIRSTAGSIDDYARTADQLRSELRTATELNRSLKADNDRISKINSQLAGEISESRQLAGTIGDYNRENANRLDEAGSIVSDCQRIAGEIRKGNKSQNK